MLLDKAVTDWLNTKPVFYNEKTGAISYDINEVIDYSDFSFNAEGLRNYLKFGYSAFGQTVVENVKYLDCCSQITKGPDGKLLIEKLEDVSKKLWNPGKTNGSEVFEKIIYCTSKWAKEEETDIILPLSGGLDSRLLAYSVKDMKNVYAYSYGLSADQSTSFEVVKAEQVAKSCNLNWKQIELNDFLKAEYIDKWYELYGASTHLHGMYQIEFFEKIAREKNSSSMRMLSGIIGDGWAGTVRIPEINGPEDLAFLGYTHGMSVDENVCRLTGSNENAENFWELHKDELKDENWRVLYAMRFKMVLLHYLLKTPGHYGMEGWSPFLDPEIAMDILNLDWSLKKDRKWQHEEFSKRNLELGWEKDKCDYNLVIDIETLRKNPVKALDSDLLGEVIKKAYVDEINTLITKKPLKVMPARPKTVKNIYNKAIRKYNNKIDRALINYEILGSIEKLLINAKEYR